MEITTKNKYTLELHQMEMEAMNLWERGRIRGYSVNNTHTPGQWEMAIAVTFLPEGDRAYDTTLVWRAASWGMFDGGLGRRLHDEILRMNAEDRQARIDNDKKLSLL